ncbi:MAG: hypothetical protein CL849_00130 [Crocinitomicaceae bacterium]|nr:hypothetical protein [Crocinitomicaceae bacterium]
MDNATWRVFLLWAFVALPCFALAQSIEVEILHAQEVSRDPSIVEAQRLIGDVALMAGDAEVVCDSAWRFPAGRFRLMGGVEAVDGLAVLTGDVLELFPDSGIGRMTGRIVRLVDSTDPLEPRTLTTQRATYNFRSGVARFFHEGVVTTASERIESRSGWYDRKAGAMGFDGHVVMTLDTVQVRSEKVRYWPEDRRLDLLSAAEVSHPSGGILCSEGQWTMGSQVGWFIGGDSAQARFIDGALVVLADSLAMADSLGYAYGNVALRDTATTYRLEADTLRFDRADEDGLGGSNVAMNGRAVAHLYEGGDPLRVSAPMMDIEDNIDGRFLRAHSGAALHFGEVTAAAQDLIWSEEAGRLDLDGSPVLWNGTDQLTGDSVRLFLSAGNPERLEVRRHAFVVSPAGRGFYNQMAGRNLDGIFRDGRLENLVMLGNGRTLYFAEPDTASERQASTDSLPALLPQANRAACTEIRMALDTAGLSSIALFSSPSGRFSDLASLEDAPLEGASDAAHLPGFNLRSRPDSAIRGEQPMFAAVLPVVEWTAPPDSLRPEGEEPIVYSAADSIIFYVREEQVALHGEAKVETAGIELTAAEVDYFAGDRVIEASGVADSTGALQGKPVFTQGGKSFTQVGLRYDLDSRKGMSRQAVTKEGELTFHADRAKRYPDGRIFLRGGMFSTCDAERPHFHFHLTKGLLIPDEKVISGPMYVKVRKIPLPIGLPFFWFPQKQERSRGLIFPSFGNGRDLGYFIKDLGWYEPLGEHWDARVQGDLYSRGTWRLAGTAQYRYRYRFNGNLQVSRSSIVSGGTAGDPGATRRTEFFVRWSHNQDSKARPNGRFNANVNFGSSGNFRSQLNSSQEDFLSNSFSSSINYNASIPGKPISITATARHNQNSNTNRVDLVVPSLGINVSRFELPLSRLINPDAVSRKWYDRIGVTYALKSEQKISGPDSTLFEDGIGGLIERATAGVRHTATASTQIKAGFISFTPNVSYNGYWNFAALDKTVSLDVPDSVVTDTLRGLYADGDWRLGVSANTKFYGTLNNRGDGRLRAIRHVITPQVGFSYNPAFQRRDTVVGIDGSILEVYDPLAPGLYTPGEIGAQGSLNFTLNNNLEVKIRDREGEIQKVRIIDNLSLRANHNLQADSLRWSDISGSAFTTLAGRFPVNLGFSHSLYDRDSTGATVDRFLWAQGKSPLRLKRMNASVNGSWSGKGEMPWNIRAGYTLRLQRNWRDDLQADTTILSQNLTVSGNVTLFEDWRVTIGSGYDFTSRDFTNTQVNLLWDLHCWEFSARWVPFGIQQSLQLRLAVKASMLRDVKVEKRFQGAGLIR